jgi:hypothetical protein
MIEFDRIIAYGCSMTCADETLDHIFVDAMTEYEVDKSKIELGGMFCPNWNAIYYKPEYCSDKTLFDVNGRWDWGEQLRRTKEVAWPRWLADKFGVSWVNRGLGGAGIEHAIYCYEEDVVTGKIGHKDLVLFGLTSPNRWFWVTENGVPKKPLLSFNADWPSPKFHQEYVAAVGNTYQTYWDYYLQIKYIDGLHHQTGGRVKSFFVTAPHDNYYSWVTDPTFWNSTVHKITQQTKDLSSIMKLDYYFKSYEYRRDSNNLEPHPLYCGFGHPKISEHQVMAEELYKYLINE